MPGIRETTVEPLSRPGKMAPPGGGRSFARRTFARAMNQNLRVLRRLASQPAVDAPACDIGCWDGQSFLQYAPRGRRLLGLELDAMAASRARDRGIDAITCDLTTEWPLATSSIGLVTSNQVIEHLLDVDHFVSESFRVLRPGGRAVISTENLASWHNICALALGWQPFSLTNISSVASGLGNPCANLRDEQPLAAGWQHVHVMTTKALRELFVAHGFVRVSVHGAGYYPLPATMGRLDPSHAAFITVDATRP